MKTSVKSIRVSKYNDYLDEFVEREIFVQNPRIPESERGGDLRRKMLFSYASRGLIIEESVPMQLLYDIQAGVLDEFVAAPLVARRIMLVMRGTTLSRLLFYDPEEWFADPFCFEEFNFNLRLTSPKAMWILLVLREHERFRKVCREIRKYSEPLLGEIEKLESSLAFYKVRSLDSELLIDDLR